MQNDFILRDPVGVTTEQQEHLKQIRQRVWNNVKYRIKHEAIRGNMQNRLSLINMNIRRNEFGNMAGIDPQKLHLFLKLFYPSDECVKRLMPRIIDVEVFRLWLQKNLDKVSIEQLQNAIQNNVNGIFIIVHEVQVSFKKTLNYTPNSIQAIYFLKDVCLRLVMLQERQQQHNYIRDVRNRTNAIQELIKTIRNKEGRKVLFEIEHVKNDNNQDEIVCKLKETVKGQTLVFEFTSEEACNRQMYSDHRYCDMVLV